MSTLDELLAEAETWVRNHYRYPTRQQLPPLIIARAPKQLIYAPISFATIYEKLALYEALRRQFRELDVYAYVSANEIWFSPRVEAEAQAAMKAGRPIPRHGLLEHEPDRQEAIMVMAYDRTDTKALWLDIKRDAKGRVVELIRNEDKTTFFTMTSGDPDKELGGNLMKLLD
jgi:hypothetical protein